MVERGDEGGISGSGKLGGGKGEAEIGLGKTRNGAAKGIGNGPGDVIGKMHGDETRLMKVNGEAGGGSEVIKNFL